MNHMQHWRRRTGLAVGTAFMAGLLVVLPVSAAPSTFVFIQNGSYISQSTTPTCVVGQWCTSMFMFVFKGSYFAHDTGNPDYPDGLHVGDRVCLEIDHDDGTPADFYYEFGCPHDTGHVSFDSLNGATLAPTTITLVRSDTSASRIVVVSGTWTATGPTSVAKSHSFGRGGGCIGFDGSNLTTRDPVFVGTVAGLIPDSVQIGKGMWQSLSACR